ncbi:MAG: tetratricopeptide repeat protein [Pyrinomonadaceae bacterium]|nr:tetratricopeptide repeat protein [Pyrinomonadaceae bacterium]
MKGRILIFVVCFFAFSANAQEAVLAGKDKESTTDSTQQRDRLLEHLSAAEKYQIAGDFGRAALENEALLAIALRRSGLIAIEEGRFADASSIFEKAVKFAEGADNRTNLAVAYMRQNRFDDALAQAKVATALDPEHKGANYILGNIYYAKEEYELALPQLENSFKSNPEFELGRALGFTYLSLKKLDLAKKHFAELVKLVGRDSADLRILIAKFYERTNYPAEAEKELKKALALEPGKARVNTFIGYLLMQHFGSERFPEAAAAFGRELKIRPNDFYALFFSGVVAASLKQPEKAIPLLTKAIRINPNSGEAYLFLGQSQVDMGDLVNAEANLRKAVELEAKGGKNTQARRTHFLLGRVLLRTGKKEEARNELKIAGELQKKALDSSRSEINRILGQVAGETSLESVDENSVVSKVDVNLKPERIEQLKKLKFFLSDVTAQGFNNLGVIATQGRRFKAALAHFSDAYEWKPDFPNLGRNLGIVAFQAGEHEAAVKHLGRHLKSNPQDALIRKMLGVSSYFAKDYSGTVAALSPMNEALYADAELSYFYGMSLIQLESNKEASEVFNKVALSTQRNPAALFNIAQGFMALGDFERAVAEFSQVLSLAPNTPKANYFIGQCLIRLNRYADAERYFSRELEISPSDPLSKYHLALTLIERKIEPERTIRILEEAILIRSDYADAHYQLGKIYLERGELQKAVDQLERAVTADATKDYVHYQLSIAYRKLKRKADADRELEIYKKLKEEKRKNSGPMPMGGDSNQSGT